jgi:outer membrane protein TolC
MHAVLFIALLAWAQGGLMTLADAEAEALANNPDIRGLQQQVRVAESRLGPALAVDDPQFGYRAWSTPLLQPWNLNQTQHMFMLTQNVPARGNRELKFQIASDDAEIQALLVEAKNAKSW